MARRERQGDIAAPGANEALARLRSLQASWQEVEPTSRLRALAERLIRMYPSRASDSLRLAAALIAAAEDSSTMDFVCLDARLAAAARRGGFAVVP